MDEPTREVVALAETPYLALTVLLTRGVTLASFTTHVDQVRDGTLELSDIERLCPWSANGSPPPEWLEYVMAVARATDP
jgi:hypothetical protein